MGSQDEDRVVAGRYRLGERLGRGGMGTVWVAQDLKLDRQVAVKELSVSGVPESELPTLHSRMLQEARAAAQIKHPGVITVHDVLEQDGRPWIVMELIDGQSLAEIIATEGTLLPRDAARVGEQVLAALEQAHRHGVLHRDVKPANVLLERSGRVVLTDFGIAMLAGSPGLTRTGDIVGSPDYVAPERVSGHRPGPESDLWSLGATLYAAVEGQSPFHRTTTMSTLQAVLSEPLPEPRHAGALGPVIQALLRKDPTERPTADEGLRMLREVATASTGGTSLHPPTALASPEPGTGTGTAGTPGTPRPAAGPGAAAAAAFGAAGAAAGMAAAAGVPGAPSPGEQPTQSTPPTPFAGTPPPPAGPQSRLPSTPPPGPPPHTPPTPIPAAPPSGPPSYGTPPTPVAGTPLPTGPYGPGGTPPPAPPEGGDGDRRRRRRMLVVAGAVVGVLLAGGVTFALVSGGGSAGSGQNTAATAGATTAAPTPSPTPTPTPSPTATPTQTQTATATQTRTVTSAPTTAAPAQPAAPAGYHWVDDPAGFRVAVPQGWTRTETNGQIDYSPDGGVHLLRFGVNPGAAQTSESHFLELEQTVGSQTDYTRVVLVANTYQGYPGALWEFTWTDPQKGPRHAVDQAFIAPSGTEYAIYMSSPDQDWTTIQQQFATVLNTFTVK